MTKDEVLTWLRSVHSREPGVMNPYRAAADLIELQCSKLGDLEKRNAALGEEVEFQKASRERAESRLDESVAEFMECRRKAFEQENRAVDAEGRLAAVRKWLNDTEALGIPYQAALESALGVEPTCPYCRRATCEKDPCSTELMRRADREGSLSTRDNVVERQAPNSEAGLKSRLDRARIAMNPREWGFAGENDVSARWHRAIPNLQLAFDRLKAWVFEDDNMVARGDEYHGIYQAPGCDCGEPGHDEKHVELTWCPKCVKAFSKPHDCL